MKVLVVNCGSSSIKYQLFEMPAGVVIARGMAERIGSGESALLLEHDVDGAGDGSVFRGRGGLARRVENAVAAACKRLGIARMGVHAFRKTWAQERYHAYREQGLSDTQARRQLSRELGHRRIDVTYHYVPRQA